MKNFIFSIFVLILFSTDNIHSQQKGIISTAGDSAHSANYSLLATIGEYTETKSSSSSEYILYSGFIYTLDTSFEGESALFAQSPGTSINNYRLISIPAALDDPSPEAVLVDDLGSYNKKKWRLFDCLDGVGATAEFPNTRDLNPGVGLFLIVKDVGKKFDIQDGSWVDSPTFTIDLHQGWNLIGNPYNLDIPVEKISIITEDSLQNMTVYAFTGEGGSGWQPADTIRSWHGYAVHVENEAQMLFEPFRILDDSSQTLNKASIIAEEAHWQIQISAKSKRAQDVWNIVGVSENAKYDRDEYDATEPFGMGEYVSIYFPHPEWGTFSQNYATDFRPPIKNGETWVFQVKSNISEPGELLFSGLEGVPEDFKIFLIDPTTEIALDLRSKNSYTFGLNSEKTREFKLLVGNSDYIQGETKNFASLPTDYVLYQNFPNPFNPSTTIRYALPRAAKVTLIIYNVLGKEVRTLVNQMDQEAGYHAAVWDGRNNQGQQVANSLYLYYLQADEFSSPMKMILVK